MRIYYWPSEHWVDDDDHAAIVEVTSSTEQDVRRLLPALEDQLYLLVNQTAQVLPETGDGGFTIGPHCIRWDVDPGRGVGEVARAALRRTLFHECHHAVRLQRRPEDAELIDWLSIAVFEGLASVFEDASGAPRASWRWYDLEVVRAWADELLARPVEDDWVHWKFDHPDGRRNIAYKVGAWIVDEAVRSSGRTAADLVWELPSTVIDLAGYSRS